MSAGSSKISDISHLCLQGVLKYQILVKYQKLADTNKTLFLTLVQRKTLNFHVLDFCEDKYFTDF